MLTLLFLTPLIHDLPSAALGVVVILTAIKLIDIPGLRRLLRIRPSDFILALVTFGGVLAFGVLPGIGFGVGVSLVEVLRRAVLPHTAVLGRLQGTTTYRDIESYEDAETIPGLVVFRFDAPLFFANADAFRGEILRLVDEGSPPVIEVIVDAESMYDIDTTGIEILVRLYDDLRERGVRLVFARRENGRAGDDAQDRARRVARAPMPSPSASRTRPSPTASASLAGSRGDSAGRKSLGGS